MRGVKRGIFLVSAIIATLAGFKAKAQVPTTAVSDTVYYANGTPAQGTVIVSWSAFTTANGAAIAAGNTTVTLGSGGALNVALAPNVGSTPMGNFYTAMYHLNDGETSREFWVVPVIIPGGGPAKLAGIRNQVLPTSVAIQAVTKQYVDAEIMAAEIAPLPLSSAPYVLKAGDTMTGPLVLPGDPASALQAADKSYVDASVAAVVGGAWGQTTPSVTCSAGSPTTAAATLRVGAAGKYAGVDLVISVTAIGTCTGGLLVTLPVTPKSSSILTCGEVAVIGSSGVARMTGGNPAIYIIDYTNAGFNTSGEEVVCSGTIETQ